MPTSTPERGQAFDLSVGEIIDFNGHKIKLVDLTENRDQIRGVIRFPCITIEVDGERAEVPSALYHMPAVINRVKIACQVTRGVAASVAKYKDIYALAKDARIRCWEPDAPLFGPKPITYPAKQLWFPTMTQMANERTYVDAGELVLNPPDRYIYHHYGMDIGGYDKAVPIVAAVGGRVVRRGEEWAPDETENERPRDDVVGIRDDAGWRCRYSHLDMIDPNLKINDRVEAGDFIGFLGKKGSSGGWSHLHFGITAPLPSGQAGQVEGYPYLVEAYLNEHPGALLANARPHRVAGIGDAVELDATRSICDRGKITKFEWTLSDGRTVTDAKASICYDIEGMYSEMLTVTDDRGQSDVDFCVVQILPPDAAVDKTPPTMHVTYFPTENIRVGQPIAFKARAFIRGPFAENKAGVEMWDFGDGAIATSCSDDEFDERWHAFDKPGRYIVTVKRTGKNGRTATAQLKVNVGQ